MPNTSKKYETTDEVHPEHANLRRIRALRDIPVIDVKQGDLGGWIECENNLAQEGDCWISDDAIVSDRARVYYNAQVSNNACVSDNAQVYGSMELRK